MKRIFTPILFIVVFIGFFACKHNANDPVPASANPVTTNLIDTNNNNNNNNATDTTLCFERDILPIFISNCAKSGCHDAASHEEGFIFTSYQTITSKEFTPGDLDETELYEKITEDDDDKIMPQPPNPPLTSAQIALIRNWILRGAPNTTNCVTGCDSTKFTFSATIQPMINLYCKGCHNNATLSGGYSYETYAGIMVAVQSGRFLGAIKREPGFSQMPKGGNKLSDCQIKQIENWIANGAQNN